MSKKSENAGFTCANCSEKVLAATNGGYRNHCPFCLCSIHIDIEPGDRSNSCLGIMRPVSIRHNTQKGWQVLHKCDKCSFERYNMTCNDGLQTDNFELITKLMQGLI